MKQADTITLPAALYWQMRALARDAEVTLLDLQRKALERTRRDPELQPYRDAWERACERRAAFLGDIGEAHGMSATGQYTWDDDTLTITRATEGDA